MEKQWIVFKKNWTQEANSEENIQKHDFKEGDVIELDKDVAEMLKKLGFADFTEEPKDGSELTGIVNKAMAGVAERIEESVTKSFANAMSSLGDSIGENLIPATAKDPNAEALRGFKSEAHFMKCVQVAAISAKTGTSPDYAAAGGKEYYDRLEKAPSGQNVSNDSEGGLLVPDVMSNRIWDNMKENPASILPLTDRYETTGNSMKVPVMFEASRKTGAGNRHAGIQVYSVDEADEITATKAKVQQRSIELHKTAAVVYFTEEQMDDAPSTWNNRIKRLVPDAIMFKVNDDFIRGSGVGKARGVLTLDCLKVVPLRSGQGNHTLFHHNLSDMYWQNSGRARARWQVHADAAQSMEFIYFDDDTTNKRPVYSPVNRGLTTDAGALFVGPYGNTMLIDELASDFGSVGDVGLYDWSQYATLVKVGGGVKEAMSIHVRFLFEETAFRFSFRVGGTSFWTAPKEDYQGDTTRSPFTVLASRTGGGTSSGL